MSSSDSIEEKFEISRSVFTSYLVSTLCFEYVLAQNQVKNPKGYKFLTGIEQLAKESVIACGIPEIREDIEILNQEFMKKIAFAIRSELL